MGNQGSLRGLLSTRGNFARTKWSCWSCGEPDTGPVNGGNRDDSVVGSRIEPRVIQFPGGDQMLALKLKEVELEIKRQERNDIAGGMVFPVPEVQKLGDVVPLKGTSMCDVPVGDDEPVFAAPKEKVVPIVPDPEMPDLMSQKELAVAQRADSTLLHCLTLTDKQGEKATGYTTVSNSSPNMADGDPEGEQRMRHKKKFQKVIRELLYFTESWLNTAVPSHAIQPAEFFSVHRMDRPADSGKWRDGLVCVMVNNSWCNNANVITPARSCSPNLVLLALKFRPFYLPLEFTSVIVNIVYIPPQVSMDTALWELHGALTQFQAKHWDAALIMVGHFNSANLKRAVPKLYQHITFPTRGNRTLDHCYTPYKDSYKALAHPPCGKSDHAAIFLLPKYKQRLKWEAPVQREFARWTHKSVAALDDADWDMFRHSTDDVSKFMEAVVRFIGKLVDDMIPRATIMKFSQPEALGGQNHPRGSELLHCCLQRGDHQRAHG
ncbi:hypothetical protein P4O66_019608 [Electrophorus voltai]|uniref:Endonuclease/exonuclease/phosphatase domain-containing protein n=1 Tax=Electrophorus voltai TaxID=2609070 RepID=A0AAD8ZU04_9TELE|nr:hypothetical protein P4O66_019608 [Electrophorus voltai]